MRAMNLGHATAFAMIRPESCASKDEESGDSILHQTEEKFSIDSLLNEVTLSVETDWPARHRITAVTTDNENFSRVDLYHNITMPLVIASILMVVVDP